MSGGLEDDAVIEETLFPFFSIFFSLLDGALPVFGLVC